MKRLTQSPHALARPSCHCSTAQAEARGSSALQHHARSFSIMIIVIGAINLASTPVTIAQTSSIGARARAQEAANPSVPPPRETPNRKINPIYEYYSWVSIPDAPPKKFKVNDLLTVIVRQQRQFEADADLETQKKWDISSELDAFFKPIEGGLGSAAFRRGKPNVGYKFDSKVKNDADTSRRDRLTTRLAVKIIDVKPNGTLVIEGRAQVTHDEEISTITLTGTCRKEDVTPDNTVLSTQIADLAIEVDNRGALRASSSRGWLVKLLDILKPI